MNKFKCKNKYDLLKCIRIYNDEDALLGYLRPVTQDYRISLPKCAALFAKWRNENPTLSVQPFVATTEGTEKWLDNQILNRDDRILFLILLTSGESIGHIGFSNFEYGERCCEVDAVLRGEKNALPGMMAFAMRALIRWGISMLKLKIIRLRVFSDNSHAIHFYNSNGFIIERENLPSDESVEKFYTLMRLNPDAWTAKKFL